MYVCEMFLKIRYNKPRARIAESTAKKEEKKN